MDSGNPVLQLLHLCATVCQHTWWRWWMVMIIMKMATSQQYYQLLPILADKWCRHRVLKLRPKTANSQFNCWRRHSSFLSRDKLTFILWPMMIIATNDHDHDTCDNLEILEILAAHPPPFCHETNWFSWSLQPMILSWTRILGALWAPTFSWWFFEPFDFIFCAL